MKRSQSSKKRHKMGIKKKTLSHHHTIRYYSGNFVSEKFYNHVVRLLRCFTLTKARKQVHKSYIHGNT